MSAKHKKIVNDMMSSNPESNDGKLSKITKINLRKGREKSHNISLVDENMSVHGNVIAPVGLIEVLGVIYGGCYVENMFIREGGYVNGNIIAVNVVIKGEVVGSITADKVCIKSGGKVVGDVFYGNLYVENDALVEGTCKRNQNKVNLEEEINKKLKKQQS